MIEEEGVWSFVVRGPSGIAIKNGHNLCWEASGMTRAAAEGKVRTRAGKVSGLPEEDLELSGGPENYRAEEIERDTPRSAPGPEFDRWGRPR